MSCARADLSIQYVLFKLQSELLYHPYTKVQKGYFHQITVQITILLQTLCP